MNALPVHNIYIPLCTRIIFTDGTSVCLLYVVAGMKLPVAIMNAYAVR